MDKLISKEMQRNKIRKKAQIIFTAFKFPLFRQISEIRQKYNCTGAKCQQYTHTFC